MFKGQESETARISRHVLDSSADNLAALLGNSLPRRTQGKVEGSCDGALCPETHGKGRRRLPQRPRLMFGLQDTGSLCDVTLSTSDRGQEADPLGGNHRCVHGFQCLGQISSLQVNH